MGRYGWNASICSLHRASVFRFSQTTFGSTKRGSLMSLAICKTFAASSRFSNALTCALEKLKQCKPRAFTAFTTSLKARLFKGQNWKLSRMDSEAFKTLEQVSTNFKSLRFQKVLCSTPSMPSTYFNVFQQFQHLRPFASALWPPAVLNKVLAPEVTHCSPATCEVTVCDSIETPCENIANT